MRYNKADSVRLCAELAFFSYNNRCGGKKLVFSEEIINYKNHNKDKKNEKLQHVKIYLSNHLQEKYELKIYDSICADGGAAFFRVQTNGKDIFLKVKEKYMYVESRLEEETEFIKESGLYHEYCMLKQAKNAGVNVPNVFFFGSDDNYDFLGTEYIAESLLDVIDQSEIDDIIKLWAELYNNVKCLYDHGIVHTDIHEHNIRVKKGKIVLVDFEESRFLKQSVEFEKSLDYLGYNGISNVGVFSNYMNQEYTVPYTCLSRILEIFKSALAKKLFLFASKCNYDSTNGICTTLDHGKTDKTYQEISNKYFSISGQRDENVRIDCIEGVCDYFFGGEKFCHVDIGSNNGLFGRELAKCYKKQCRSIGLEGTHNYNVLARGLAFLDDAKDTQYMDFICGEDCLDKVDFGDPCLVTVFSVWHHIVNKRKVLDELKKKKLKAIIFEFAIDKELYIDGDWKSELKKIKKYLCYTGECLVASSEDYHRPIVLITPDVLGKKEIDKIQECINSRIENNKNKHSFSNKLMFDNYCNRKKNQDTKYVVCYGAGAYGRKACNFIGENDIVFYIDNNKKETGFSSHEVLTEDEAIRIIDDDTLVIVSMIKKNALAIEKKLKEKGIKNIKFLEDLLEEGYIKYK